MKPNLKTLIEDCKNPELFRDDILRTLFAFEKELLDKLVNEKGIVTINDDNSTRDVLIGIKEILG